MAGVDETIDLETRDLPSETPEGKPVAGLVLLWSRDESPRSGEVALIRREWEGQQVTLGRAGQDDAGDAIRLEFVRQRPGLNDPCGPLTTPSLSRAQLGITARADGRMVVENLGRGELLINGEPSTVGEVAPGDLLEVNKRVLLLCQPRPLLLAQGHAPSDHVFGQADARGVVGEGPAAWRLRQQVAFLAKRSDHVLVQGASGTGKELVAQALHSGSSRGKKALVSRNAATIPATLMDAELFGNVKNYPNPGMPERPGLIGEASGATLFLDEFAELPVDQQAHLLRVLDEGEYHRLGESKSRQADLRLVAATNRSESAFKEDVLARFKLRMDVPGLNERPEDVPLLARHLIRRLASDDPELAGRYFPDGDTRREPRLSLALVAALVRHPFRTHVRELETLLWQSILKGRPDKLDLWDGFPAGDEAAPEAERAAAQPAPGVDPNALSADEVQACLDKHDGKQEPVWRELGLSSRHVLTRLVKKHGLRVKGR
jgi:two-component system nitrogen regulation response regulator GlnG/two-component system response regulator HydG